METSFRKKIFIRHCLQATLLLAVFPRGVACLKEFNPPPSPTPVCRDDQYLKHLQALLWPGSEEGLEQQFTDSLDGISEAEKITLEAGNAALPILQAALPTREDTLENYMRGKVAACCIALLGGGQARDILKKESSLSGAGGSRFQKELCLCMGSTGTQEDVEFLIQSLENDCGSAAAYCLGILKAKEAVAALKTCVSKSQDGFEVSAAKKVLEWMERGPSQPCRINMDGRDDEKIMASVIDYDPPDMDKSRAFVDYERKNLWTFRQDVWEVTKFRKTKELNALSKTPCIPSISFCLFKTRNGSKAVVSLELFIASLAVSGFKYVLIKENGEWRVIGMMATWIS